MGLMYGNGPLGRRPAGHFNFEPPAPGTALYLEPTPRRIRVVVGGETVADSRNAFMLHESGHQPVYYFPADDVRSELLESSDRHTHCPKKGDASYWTIRANGTVVEAGAWYYPDPLPGAAGLKGLVAFYWHRMDHWYEEDEEVFVHPRDPYHRVDVVRSERHVRISLDGKLLAETTRALAVFESNLPTRWYMPLEDVVAELEPSDKTTQCPYKGTANYYSLADAGRDGEDLIWYYAEPHAEVVRIAGLVCFYNERVALELDGELQERPESRSAHAVGGTALTAQSAQPRG
jgi:uncharacterized protein (DUF427 family)